MNQTRFLSLTAGAMFLVQSVSKSNHPVESQSMMKHQISEEF